MPEGMTAVKESGIFDVEVPEVYLFVCTGNTCRSPMAAALFNALYPSLGVAVSAGFSSGGSSISRNAVAALEARGISSVGRNDYKSHVSRRVTEAMVAGAKLVIGISSWHAMALISGFPQYAEKIVSLGDISDPYGGDEEVYRACLADIEAAEMETFGEPERSNG